MNSNNMTAISWTSLTVSVNSFMKNSKMILNTILGSFSFNTINAIMGPSGSGKTTLMKSLNTSNKYMLSPESEIYLLIIV